MECAAGDVRSMRLERVAGDHGVDPSSLQASWRGALRWIKGEADLRKNVP